MNAEEILQHASLVRPCLGERVSGDAVVVRPIDEGLFAAIIDVLGHGPQAHELALEIDAYLARHCSADVASLMTRLHRHLAGSRGAAVGMCAFDARAGELAYVGIGNTVLRRFGSADTRLVSREGVLGQNMRTPRTQTLPLDAGDLIVLYTDGVRDRFSSEDYPTISHHPPQEVVRTLIRRFGKDHDDAACIAVRYGA